MLSKTICGVCCEQVPSVLQSGLQQQEMPWVEQKKALLGGKTALKLGNHVEVTISFRPLVLSVAVAGQPAIVFNGGHMFAFEHRRQKQVYFSCSDRARQLEARFEGI